MFALFKHKKWINFCANSKFKQFLKNIKTILNFENHKNAYMMLNLCNNLFLKNNEHLKRYKKINTLSIVQYFISKSFQAQSLCIYTIDDIELFWSRRMRLYLSFRLIFGSSLRWFIPWCVNQFCSINSS